MRFFAPLLLLPLIGCASNTVQDFAKFQPEMRIDQYFEGDSTGYGLFLNRAGDVKRQFKVAMHGHRDGDLFKLDEDFTYDDGEKQERHWTFRPTGDGSWEGTAPDVIGVAPGEFSGNAYRMHYVADIKAGSSSYRLDFDDWLFRQNDHIVLNHTNVTKLGIDVGEVQLTFVK